MAVRIQIHDTRADEFAVISTRADGARLVRVIGYRRGVQQLVIEFTLSDEDTDPTEIATVQGGPLARGDAGSP